MKNIYKGALCIAITLVIAFIPPPQGVTPEAWRLLAIFIGTIVGLILEPLPMGAVALIAIAVTALSKAVPYKAALSGFSNSTIWLIVSAFLFACGFIKTGLGKRIAFLFIKMFGKTTLGLSYSLMAADLVLAPATPSNTARAGGILYPIIRSLCSVFGSEPDNNPRKIGAFLIKTEYQVNLITSAMFMTAMAANPLVAELAKQTAGVDLTWGTWFLAGLVPGILSLMLIPLLIYKIYPPEIKKTPEATEFAKKELKKLGPMTGKEKTLLVIFFVVLSLWATTKTLHNIDATIIAFAGISLMLIFNVIQWEDVLKEKSAWNTLIWFSSLVMMASYLNKLGLIKWFAENVSTSLAGMNWTLALILAMIIYLYAHYAFASMTAHVASMYPAFLAVAVTAGAPPVLAALGFAYFSNLNASMTHYATGPAPIYFGSGYIPLPTWWKIGFLVSVVNICIWIPAGFCWWKILGMW